MNDARLGVVKSVMSQMLISQDFTYAEVAAIAAMMPAPRVTRRKRARLRRQFNRDRHTWFKPRAPQWGPLALAVYLRFKDCEDTKPRR